jgi:protein SERAC1
VHGLTGNRENTWTHQNKVFWPRDLLTHDLPDARIMTFGYDADVVKIWGMTPAGSNGLHGHGKSLAYALSDSRSAASAKERPLILVAHSLGGLVCEQAMLVCRAANELRLKSVLQSVVGIVFLGTPHRGSDLAAWGSIVAKYLHRIRSVNRNIIKTLELKSEVLASVEQDFQQLLLTPEHVNRTRIFCFYEELAVPLVGKIVPDESAILEQYSNLSIHGNHMDMTKFSASTDNGYRAVCGVLKDWINQIEAMTPESVQAVEKPHKLTKGSTEDSTTREETETGSLIQKADSQHLQTRQNILEEVASSETEAQDKQDQDDPFLKNSSQRIHQGHLGGTTINGNMNTGGGPLIMDSTVSGNTFRWGT